MKFKRAKATTQKEEKSMRENVINKNSTDEGRIKKNRMDEVAVLIPCYNESKTIEKVVTDFRRELPDAVIYVYDNNSTDNTVEIAKQAGAVVRHEYQQGKGNVVRRMFQEIDAHCYILVDGDDTYPAESAGEMVRLVMEHNADMVVGDRLSSTYFEENKRPFHNLGNRLVRGMVSKFFHGSIRDIMTGYRAFSYRFVKTFPILSCRFEIETEMSIHAIDKRMLWYFENRMETSDGEKKLYEINRVEVYEYLNGTGQFKLMLEKIPIEETGG